MQSRKMVFVVLLTIAVIVTPLFSCFAAAPTLAIEGSTVCEKGAYIDLPIRISGNPGIIALQVFIQYDASVLTLDSVTDGGLLGKDIVQSEDITDNPFTISWAMALETEDNTSNGILTTLRFKVSDTATGQTTVRLSYSQESAFNYDLQPVRFATQNSTVTVVTPSLILSATSLELEQGSSGTVSFTTTPAGQEVSVCAVDVHHTQYSQRDTDVIFTGESCGTDTYDIVMSYGGEAYTARIAVTVVNPPKVMTSIDIVSAPARVEYTVGDALDTSGMVVQAVFSDGSTETIDSWICSPTTFASVGMQDITVTYYGDNSIWTTAFTVAVTALNIAIQNAKPEIMLDYRTTIEFRANVTDPVADAQIRWFVDEREQGSGDSFTVWEIKKGFTVQAKYIKGNRILAESAPETVKVNASFFARVKAFFRGLFGKLPIIVQEYIGMEKRGFDTIETD